MPKFKATTKRPVTTIDVDLKRGKKFKLLMLFDVHWDNPKCDHGMLRRHLEYAKKEGAAIMFGGDLFCVMQGKYDRRSNKSDVRPEHQSGSYLDQVVKTAAEWFAPYKDQIVTVGYGNHETALINRLETDLIDRFCYSLGIPHRGGYGGYIVTRLREKGNVCANVRLKYFHGAGGGGPVTKGTIQANRRQVMYPDADIIATGHIHESWEMEYVTERINTRTMEIEHKTVLHVQCPTYKEEYGSGAGGWHVERGAPPKPVGGKMLNLELLREGTGDRRYKWVADIERLH